MKDEIVKAIEAYLNKAEVPKEKWDGTVGFFPAEWPFPISTLADEITERLLPIVGEKDYPFKELFDHISNEHGLTLLDTELDDIIHIARGGGNKTGWKQAKFYNPDEYPTRVDGEEFSVDVFILDETGVHGIAFWNFDDEVWRFHTDTLVDYNEKGTETKWKWYYPPFELKTVFA